jgi:hypothetical protein
MDSIWNSKGPSSPFSTRNCPRLRVDVAPEQSYKTKVIQTSRTAADDGADNGSVCTTWLLVDWMQYYCWTSPENVTTAVALAERYHPTAILVENASTGIALPQELRQSGIFVADAVPINRDKITAMREHGGRISRSRLRPIAKALGRQLALSATRGRNERAT